MGQGLSGLCKCRTVSGAGFWGRGGEGRLVVAVGTTVCDGCTEW
jgi:hypothetical protein